MSQTIRILADENIAATLVFKLRQAGYDVTYIAELHAGLKDGDVLELARKESRVLLTEDKDFGELVYRLKARVTPIILLRIPDALREQKWPRLRRLLNEYSIKLADHYAVVELQKIRFRKLRKH